MDRVFRWILIAAVVTLGWIFIPRLFGGGGSSDLQPIGVGQTETSTHKLGEAAPAKCTIRGRGFRAELSSRGAALVDYWVTDNPRYMENGQPIELTTVPGSAPDRFSLHFDWRALGTAGENAQAQFDVVDWQIDRQDGSSCSFRYADDRVRLEKTIRIGQGPYELLASATIENASETPRVHRLGIENTTWRKESEVGSSLGTQSPYQTEVVCLTEGGKAVRKSPSDFAAKDFQKPEFQKGWFVSAGPAVFASTASAYYAQALVPLTGPARPECALQIEERWYHDRYQDKSKDPDFGAMYRSRLVYPEKQLGPGERATYEILAYVGPKDRVVLANAAEGRHQLSQLINLGFFAPISRVLVGFLVQVHRFVGNWGIAIIVLTLVVRIVLFPLTWKQIKSMVGMRQLKPQLDEINKKFKSDPQQKQLAMMEVYRKNGVNPLGGCLPILIQMPVWWALYTVLQTAVELYHTPFLWFPDLSARDPVFVLPIVIGATSFIQQKMMPQQADAQQQKMLLYFMPAVFTVMMLFLPAGLGVYILTNSVIGIIQQQVTERLTPAQPTVAKGASPTSSKGGS